MVCLSQFIRADQKRFMDAEIGVRNLADTFRYNVLPDVIQVIGWNRKDIHYEDLSDCEKLLWMVFIQWFPYLLRLLTSSQSKAQAELNYAVHYSFSQAGVTCISTLAASESWCAFDDQHFEEKGYRLNADPYWISPPQGSIIPLWHRGAAPNYQPKPLIAKNRCDPVKTWKKRTGLLTKFNRKDLLHSIPRVSTHLLGLTQELADESRILLRPLLKGGVEYIYSTVVLEARLGSQQSDFVGTSSHGSHPKHLFASVLLTPSPQASLAQRTQYLSSSPRQALVKFLPMAGNSLTRWRVCERRQYIP